TSFIVAANLTVVIGAAGAVGAAGTTAPAVPTAGGVGGVSYITNPLGVYQVYAAGGNGGGAGTNNSSAPGSGGDYVPKVSVPYNIVNSLTQAPLSLSGSRGSPGLAGGGLASTI